MKEMICITCPIGCHLNVEFVSENEITVSGNKCPRGEQYARAELLSPKRVVTATCDLVDGSGEAGDEARPVSLYTPRRVPVRTVKAFPREKIPELLALIYAIKVPRPVRSGQVIMRDALGTGIDVIVTRSM
jgi:CxxC motif-containing protein